MNGFRFQDPVWVLLLIPLIFCGWLAMRRQRRAVVLYSSVEILKQLPKTLALRVKRLLPWLKVLGLCLIVVALARPQHGREEFRIRTEGISIEMCVDRSGSMLAQDFVLDEKRVNRLEAVKHVFQQFVAGDGEFEGRADDLIGVVGFGGFADAVCPQTLDHGALLEVLKTLKVAEPVRDASGRVINAEMLGEEQATAIGDAVALAVDRLKDVEAKSKVIILLSDGE
ncbi:MAG: VWA domain-containing protein, partial [Planctomycetaceae bacterium]